MDKRRYLRGVLATIAAVTYIMVAMSPTSAVGAAASGLDPLQVEQAHQRSCQTWLDIHPEPSVLHTQFAKCVDDEQQLIDALTTQPSPSPTDTPSPTTTPSTNPSSPNPSQSPTTLPTTSPPPSTTPPTSPQPSLTTTPPTPSPTPTNPITGAQITTANTGYLAWIGGLGQRCTNPTVYATKVNASTLGNATCVWLQQGINVNAAITLTAARISAETDATGPRLTCNFCTFDAIGDEWAVGGHVTTYRGQLYGASDGVRFYGTNLVQTYVRTHSISAGDHNDGIQAYRATEGGTIIGCNIDGRPDNAPSGVWGNAAIFLADNSTGEVSIRDNYLAGGGYTLRLHEAMRYRVTNNVIVAGSWLYGPLSTTNAVSGAFLEWASNRTSSGTVLNP